ncbi:LacI family DNA-binding transcriptional regulator [Devosia sp.]|uniref:LacI family DNA-binding transcriptional regulator n=1 Tax=Devosia sp. TaxID=1871048 RepID=UPI003A8ED78B
MSTTDDIGRKRSATIVEVAERAGVAIGTVSRYLNGHPIRRGNRDQIEAAIAALGYRRNAVAAAMKSDLTNTVGFMVPSLSEFHSPVLEHLSRRMRAGGRAMLSYCHNSDDASVVEALDFFDMHRVDCLIMDGHAGVDDRIRDLVANGTPVIFYDNDVPGLPVDRVFVENRAASFRAVSHLLDIGHTRIAVLTGSTDNFSARERFEGYRQALDGRGLSVDPSYVLDMHWNEDEAYSGMLRLLSLAEPPTALFCCNYNMTFGALRMLKEHGLKVPDDISLVSFDDVPLFQLHDTGITAIAQPLEKIAESISGIVESRLSERGVFHEPHVITLNCDIILRGSTRRMLTPDELARYGQK